jgi:hypothetical protein
MAQDYSIRTKLYHLDTEAGLPSHTRMQSQPFRMIGNWAVYHHTGKYNIRISAIALHRRGASLTRCLRRLHLLHAKFTRDFRGADVDVVLAVDAVRTASGPCCSNTGSVDIAAASVVSDSLERPGDELS